MAAYEQMNQREPMASSFRNLCTNPNLQVRTMGIVLRCLTEGTNRNPSLILIVPSQENPRDPSLEGWEAKRREYPCATALRNTPEEQVSGAGSEEGEKGARSS